MVCVAFMRRKLYTPDLKIVDDFAFWSNKSDHLSDLFADSSELSDYSEKLFHCGDWLSFTPSDDGDGYHLTGASFCRKRLCPCCQWRRSQKIYAQLSDLWDSLQSSGFVVLHLVLTVKNCSADDLTSTINHLYKSSSRLFRLDDLRGFRGVLRFCEVTYSMNDYSYHPHLHCLIAVLPSYFHSRDYLSHDRIRHLWADSLGVGYLPQVNIQRADDSAVKEVSKYCVKPFEFDGLSRSDELGVYRVYNTALHGRRMIQGYGVIRSELRRLRLDLNDDTDDIEKEEGGTPLSEKRIFAYDHISGAYNLKDFS